MIENILEEAAAATPDPGRALKNLSSFIEENPDHGEALQKHIRSISLLFSHSQFLANYSNSHPEDLIAAIDTVKNAVEREAIAFELKQEIDAIEEAPQRTTLPLYMNAVRRFRLKQILKIALRDILKKADLVDIMLEMSCLADVIIEGSLDIVRRYVRGIYGPPEEEQFSVIALGKLGAEELNFSSDVDFMYVYNTELGETSGVLNTQGVRTNRTSNHEYYCKIGEELSKFLSQNTEAGFVYRVDLRLRPEGQRGAIALALRGYEMYYESWGRAWERAMLLRARPVAGDEELGRNFMEMIRPFVYRKYLDFTAIDEISKLKTRIDATFKRTDIKRGYGGIREIEFFSQALQLIYAGREPLLRERNVLKILHRLFQKGLIGGDDYGILSGNYRYLRTLEHRLQQVNDLQTHTLPVSDAELEVLGRKMGYTSKTEFTDDLEKRRAQVRTIYDSLFGVRKEESSTGHTLFDEEFSDSELKEFLSGAGLKDVPRALRNIRSIRDSTFNFQTLRGRRLLSDILPMFVDSSLKSGSPDSALNHVQSFAQLLSTNESYLEVFSKNRTLIDLIVYVFSQSNYLSKMLMSRPQYLEMIGWQETLRKSLGSLRAEIGDSLSEGGSISDAVRLVKQIEEIRLGMLFLRKRIDVVKVTRGLSRTAEAVLSSSFEQSGGEQEGMAVISFGKLGGREIAFGSDLDLIFVSEGDVQISQTRTAEKLLRMLISYTQDGIAYSVDTRLRPEGSKGPLVSSVEAFRKYYAASAAFWEFQALLKARPVAGDIKTGCAFMQLAHEILAAHGATVNASDIRKMRERIMRERAKESEGYDIKLGPGGIEEIEFMVQFLQLKNCAEHKKLFVQDTVGAIRRLAAAEIVVQAEAMMLRDAYLFSRTIECLLRLQGEAVLKKDEASLRSVSEFMGSVSTADFMEQLETTRKAVREAFDRYLPAV